MEAAQSKPTENLRIQLGFPTATKGAGKTPYTNTSVMYSKYPMKTLYYVNNKVTQDCTYPLRLRRLKINK